jgi:ABC-type antimicrobial peptide transport system permease subunit
MLSMARAERVVADVGGGFLGMGERMTWLLLASMVVCIVGVTNAMLMSVTERFREIATLKCLGAMDDFIMLMFVFEAGLLGLAGGFIGAFAGGVIGVARMFATLGLYMVPLIPFGPLAAAIVASVAVGMVLASVGAVYPSLKAARLAPMEAMRIQ